MLHIVTLNLRLLSENQGQAKDAFETIPKNRELSSTEICGDLFILASMKTNEKLLKQTSSPA